MIAELGQEDGLYVEFYHFWVEPLNQTIAGLRGERGFSHKTQSITLDFTGTPLTCGLEKLTTDCVLSQ
jgi:hypothetical protein